MVKNRIVSRLQLILCICFALAVGRGANAQTLFYSGNLTNSGNTNQIGAGNEQTFDVFKITAPLGWKLSSIYSNDFQLAAPPDVATTANWSIRTGMSTGAGGGGTTLFSGTTVATQTPTGRTAGGFPEFTVGVNISSLGIILGPGTYWLQVSPVGAHNRWFNSTTSGASGVNAVNGNNGLSFVGGSYMARNADFSMGINGTVNTPEGSSLAMFALGGLPLAIGFGRKLRRKKA
ncbi:MAG: hypothetical protein JWN14_5009 [Chthonomonadales bacterium]|nr:hypothetical protein [Chthonomonadales bacterium]